MSNGSFRRCGCCHGCQQSSPTAARVSVLGAAAHGLPQLVVPLFADQWENAGAVTGAGCGIVLGPDRRSRDDIADALREVLDSPALRQAATAVAGEIAVMPTATDLVADVEALAG